MTDWKPGDVVLIDLMFEGAHVALRGRGCWHYRDGEKITAILDGDAEVKSARPLVVIDPDSDDEASRLWRLLPDNLVSIDQLQAALREFAQPTPPRPDEPTGLGAVVEDTAGNLWLRLSDDVELVRCWGPAGNIGAPHMSSWVAYADIDVVRVLSEGVTP